MSATGPASTRAGLARWFGPWVSEVDRGSLRADAMAGLLGALLVLPQAIAFSALAGLPPGMGLVASGLPCALAALAGSSRQVLTGPTNATALAMGAMLAALTGAVGSAGAVPVATLVPLAIALTLLVGVLQLALAGARLGALANFVSPSVMLGFTTGAALLIAWYAAAGLMGATGRVSPLVAWRDGVSPAALWVGGVTLAAALAGRRWWRRGPHMLAALGLGIALAWAFERGHWPSQVPAVPALQRVGQAPSAWPSLDAVPQALALLPAQFAQLVPLALALTIVALGQALAIAKVLAARTGQPLDANRECLGQGLANLGSALGGGMVVCGSLNRSLPNLEAGARTPLAGVIGGLLLIVLASIAAPLLAWIPMAGVNALLLVVAWALIDTGAWRRLRQLETAEFTIAAVTAVATVLLRLEVAILSGVMLSLVVYLYRASRPALRTMGFDRDGPDRPFVVLDDAHANPLARPECPQLKLLRMEGSVWFGAVPHVADHLRSLHAVSAPQPHLLVMAKSMNFIDLAAADLWDDERRRRRERGGDLYFHRPRPQVIRMWRRTGFLGRLGDDHLFPDKRRAIRTIVDRLDPAVCARCRARVFEECGERPGAEVSPVI